MICVYLEIFIFEKVVTDLKKKKEVYAETHVTVTSNPGAHLRLLKSRVNENQM